MRESGKVTGYILNTLEDFIKPGMSTMDIDRYVEETIRKNKMIPSFKGYGGFPGSACVSINEEVVHGIPDKKRIIREGDIVSVDVGSTYKGYVSDAARTYAIGKVDPEAQRLIDVTRESFFEGIKFAKAGYRLTDISHAIQVHAENAGFSVIRVFAIEPMICQGGYEVETLLNDWTVVTADGKLAAHYENTVVINDGEPELLTL